MNTNWKKIREQIPEFDKLVIVKTNKNIYAVISLSSIVSSKKGIQYNWNLNNLYTDFEETCGKVVEWCEIPN